MGLGVRALMLAVAAGCSSHSAVPYDAGAPEASVDAGPAANPPRPLAPLSVSFTNSRRPTFRWQLAPGSDGARVEVCRDRACDAMVETFDAAGDSGSPPDDLPGGVLFWRLRGTTAGAAGASTSATWELVVPRVSNPRETTWGAMLDANGDGYADVVVGDSDYFDATHEVYVHHGGQSGPAAAPSEVLSASAPVASFAVSIASAADLDGDGFGDLLVGSPQEDTVYVYRGGAGGFASAPTLLKGTPKSGFGGAVASAGDLDGDGYGDILVGMPLLAAEAGTAPAGAAMVVYGGASAPSLARSAPLEQHAGANAVSFGQFVSSAGDLYGDGKPAVAVWAGLDVTDPQEIDLYHAADTGFGAAPSTRLKFDGCSSSWLGVARLLASAGDVNGDGYVDIAAASAYPPNLGAQRDHVSMFFGGPPPPAPYPGQRVDNPFGTNADFGLSVAALDANGDGFGDVAVAAAWVGAPPGPSAVVLWGSRAGLGATTVIQSSDLSGVFEREVGSVGDVDGDGYADLLVGSPSKATDAPGGGTLHGAVEVWPGGPSGVSTSARWTLLPPDTNAVAYGASLPGS